MLIVVTGATGFFGGAITEALRSGGHEVIAVARNVDAAGPGAERLDITDAAACRAVIRLGRGIGAGTEKFGVYPLDTAYTNGPFN